MRCTAASVCRSLCASRTLTPFGLIALHAAVGVEQTAQKRGMKCARAALDRRGDRAWRGAAGRDQRRAASPLRERAGIRRAQAPRSIRQSRRDAAVAARHQAPRPSRRRTPGRSSPPLTQRSPRPDRQARPCRSSACRRRAAARADNPRQHRARARAGIAPARRDAVIVEQQLVAGRKIARRAPLPFRRPACASRHPAQAMIGA